MAKTSTPACAATRAYTAEQIDTMLCFIAARADALSTMLAYLVQHEAAQDPEINSQLFTAKEVVQMIGATADEASGRRYTGGYAEWFHGAGFAGLGKRGAA